MRITWTIIAELDEPPSSSWFDVRAADFDGELEELVGGELVAASESYTVAASHEVEL